MHQLERNLGRVLARINSACAAAGHSTDAVSVLLATKTQPVPKITEAIDVARAVLLQPGYPVESPGVIVRQGANAPQSAASRLRKVIIGENRVQELVSKSADLPDVEIHFIGPLQKNKINALLTTPVSCIQTIDSIELAEAVSARLERQGCHHDDSWQLASAGMEPQMDVMVQVNVSGEASKAGCLPDDAKVLARVVAELPMLNLTGFMTIGLRPIFENSGTVIANAEEITAGYRQLREIRDSINPNLELSMGMSSDLELAIAEGATIVRIGSAIFGAR